MTKTADEQATDILVAYVSHEKSPFQFQDADEAAANMAIIWKKMHETILDRRRAPA